MCRNTIPLYYLNLGSASLRVEKKVWPIFCFAQLRRATLQGDVYLICKRRRREDECMWCNIRVKGCSNRKVRYQVSIRRTNHYQQDICLHNKWGIWDLSQHPRNILKFCSIFLTNYSFREKFKIPTLSVTEHGTSACEVVTLFLRHSGGLLLILVS